MTLDSPVTEIKGVGDSASAKFATLGIRTVYDLINHYPRRYEDYSLITPINKLKPGIVTIEAEIKSAKGRYVRRGLHITEAIASDKSGSVRIVWFNQPYRAAALKPGKQYFISGNYELSRSRFAVMNPAVELVSDLPANTARVLPVYRETKGLDSRQIRNAVGQVSPLFENIKETLPKWIIDENHLTSRAEALMSLHRPKNIKDIEAARRRLGFEEVFNLSLASQLNKREIKNEKALSISFQEPLAKDFVSHLPFKLTDGQRVTIWRLFQDMQKTEPMNRMVEGDVGSGKTVVAAMAALMAIASGKQVALMAPTELLARQHGETLYRLLKPLGYESQVVLLVGSMSNNDKKLARDAIKDGKAGFIVGTHALIQESVDMHNLALVIIDEQHRFGVEQRKALMKKAGHMPHVLSLTATPIPRSLALTLYGELDISLLKEKPGGRQMVRTEIVWPGDREKIFKEIDSEIQAGRQVFVVCPHISESSAIEARSVESVYEELKKGPFKHRKVKSMHGKMKSEEKNETMQEFVSGETDVLVSTTVIEVGVDVPNATVMLIMSPERFGLAQLHQLRGRVGRGEHQGHCYLMLENTDAPIKRLRALVSSNDGFKLAELDLDLRGPGAIYGTLQHGSLDLRVAKLTDTDLINDAVNASKEFIERSEKLEKYPELENSVSKLRAVTNLN